MAIRISKESFLTDPSMSDIYVLCWLPGFHFRISNEPRHEISNNLTFLTSVDSDEPLQPPFKLRNSK